MIASVYAADYTPFSSSRGAANRKQPGSGSIPRTDSTMPAIRVLPEHLVNKIAAGEVVERPASVLKELVENAIDAQARSIQVAVEEGGRRLIRVVDDGVGIASEELPLTVAAHATSKLPDEDTLHSLVTLGFRGEALASIGAVSHLRIVSRPRDRDDGGELRVAGLKVETCRAAGCPPGTTVEVRDLFYNVPARRKFQRTTSTESAHVNEQFARLALAWPDLAFELVSGQRTTHRLPAGRTQRDRIADLFGPELAEDLLVIDRHERGLHIEAYAAPPARSRPTLAGQFVFVNGRFIRDRQINYAVREAYRGLMDPNRNAVLFLFLRIDPAEVDVNVHPTKIEVRWQDGNLVRSQVLAALREKLLRTDLTPSLHASAAVGSFPSRPDRNRDEGTIPSSFLDESAQDELRRRFAAELKDRPPGIHTPEPVPGGDSAYGETGDHAVADALWRSLYDRPQGQTPAEPSGQPPFSVQGDFSGSHAGPALDSPFAATSPASAAWPRERGPCHPLRPAIQLHNTYLVAETDSGLVIIDQHALHERVLYEQLRQRMTAGALESQRLLLPETVPVTPRQLAGLETHADLLARLGIELSAFGPDAVAVQAFPSLLSDLEVKSFVRDLLDKLADQEQGAHPELLIQSILQMMSCKAAVKAGDPLTPAEIDALIASKDLIEKSSNCPHGRPTTLRLDLRDLERQFKRT